MDPSLGLNLPALPIGGTADVWGGSENGESSHVYGFDWVAHWELLESRLLPLSNLRFPCSVLTWMDLDCLIVVLLGCRHIIFFHSHSERVYGYWYRHGQYTFWIMGDGAHQIWTQIVIRGGSSF